MRLPLLLIVAAGCTPSASKVTLYSAQDREFAEPLFRDFETQSRLSLVSKFDTEANKSVSLANELLSEKDRPRADVHWNNEPINTIRLARQGVYEAYQSPAAKGFPEWTRLQGGLAQAFAARARVLIVNTDLVPESQRPKSLLDLLKPEWKGKVAMAKPLFGTTATHAACLFEALGPDEAKKFFTNLKANEVAILAGNKPVAVDVAAGKYAVGLTDTDDAMIEINAKRPVTMIWPDRDGSHPKLGVLYLPNMLALVKGGPNPDGGRRLIDYLLSCEEKLAQGGGFQIPLNPALANAKLPALLVPPSQVRRMQVDFEKAADRWDEVQGFLRDLFAR